MRTVVFHPIMENGEDNCFAYSACSRKQMGKMVLNFSRIKLRWGTLVSPWSSQSAPSRKLVILNKTRLFAIWDLERRVGAFLVSMWLWLSGSRLQ